MAAGQAQGMRLADGDAEGLQVVEVAGLTVGIAEAALGELGAEAEGAVAERLRGLLAG